VAVDISSLTSRRTRPALAARIRALPAEAALAVLVLVSFVARVAAAIPHSSPRLFPDEYIYAQLANSISHGRLTIRGQAAHFPALLEPLLASPLWLFGDVETAFRLTQALHALIASLIAVPVYLLARRLGLPAWQRLACSACALALPSLVYSSYVTADAVGMTLAVTSVYVGVRTLETPTPRWQIAFVALAALTTLARVQYVVLLPAYAAAALIMAHGRPLRALRQQRVAAGLVLLALAAALAAGTRSLGYYHSVLDLHVGTDVGRWAITDAMLLVYAAGYVLVPGAFVGMVSAIVRPRRDADRAAGAIAASLALLLLAEASVYAANGTDRFQERYLVSLLPLVPIFFCLCVRLPSSRRTIAAVGAASVGFVLVAANAPLSAYTTVLATQDSPVLQAVRELEQLTSTSTGSLVVAAAVAVLTVPALLAVARPRIGAPIALVAVLAVLLATSAGAVTTDVKYTRVVEADLPTDPRWVDHSGARDVSVLVTRSSLRPVVSAHLFWNKQLTRLLQMREGPDIVDSFGYSKVRIRDDGTILAGGRPVTGAVLAEEYADVATLADARLIRRDRGASLWQPNGPARLLTLTDGLFMDGWLGWPYGAVTVWPTPSGARTGVLCLPFSLPDVGSPTTLDLSAPGYHNRVTIPSGGRSTVSIPLTVTHVWTLHVLAKRPFRIGPRFVSVVLAPPRFVTGKGSRAACR
jgi:Dolichyl-phosphate-mannose-protein mannosyltransferase